MIRAFKKIVHGYSFLFFCGISFFVIISLWTIENGHNWGGDFARYILHARNIIEGNPYCYGIFSNPNAPGFPVGFPLILAPLVKHFGLNFIILKLPSVVFWCLFVVMFRLIARERTGEDMSTLLSIALLTSPYIFQFKQHILSDIPAMFFITAALWHFTRYANIDCVVPRQTRYHFSAFLICTAAAFCIRSAGLIVLLSCALYTMIIKRTWKDTSVMFVLMLALLLLQRSFGAPTSFYMAMTTPLRCLSWGLSNICFTIGSIMVFFAFPLVTTKTLLVHYAKPAIAWQILGGITVMACITYTAYLIKKRSLSPIALFVLCYFFVILLWPFHEGARLALPIAVFVLLFCAEGIGRGVSYMAARLKKPHLSVRGIQRAVVLLMIFYNSVMMAKIWNSSSDHLMNSATAELCAWVTRSMPPDKHFLFAKPQTLTLLTGRTGEYLREDSDGIRILPRADYIIVHGLEASIIEKMKAAPDRFPLLWTNSIFSVYAIRRSPP